MTKNLVGMQEGRKERKKIRENLGQEKKEQEAKELNQRMRYDMWRQPKF